MSDFSRNNNINRIKALARFLSIAATITVLLLSIFLIRPSSVGDVAGADRNYTRTVVGSESEAAGNDTSDPAEPCPCPRADRPRETTVASSLGLSGDAPDCCCSFEAIERANLDRLHPLLGRVVSTPFFAHFKVDLCSVCELWDDAPLCVLRDCAVCECEDAPAWAVEVDWMPRGAREEDCGHVDDRVVTAVDKRATLGWTSASPDSPLFLGESTASSSAIEEDSAVVVDLRLNPERYTGYAGQSAERVWAAVHQDNCFREEKEDSDEDGDPGYCVLPTEKRVYNRIISGMHSSISIHIAHSYCLEMDPDRIAECRTWGPNSALARERVFDRKERLENLYVAFAVMLRAVQRAGTAVAAAVPEDDPYFVESLSEWTGKLQHEMAEVLKSCPLAFDETSLLEGMTAGAVQPRREELGRRFRHLLRIMRCVGCDRCKLWGTLQTLGVGTALRILLEEDGSRTVDLSRQEAVAVVHTLERFSSALVYARDLQNVPSRQP